MQLTISVDNRVIENFREVLQAFALVSPNIKWHVTAGVDDTGNLVSLYETEGGTPMDFFVMGSLLFELHGTIFLDAYNSKT